LIAVTSADCSVLLDDSRTAGNQIVYFPGRQPNFVKQDPSLRASGLRGRKPRRVLAVDANRGTDRSHTTFRRVVFDLDEIDCD
jgi:hypothetical protein